ncbi:hypothetical protein [Streptomyces sp. NPDC046685]|uniref:hypothetical protein n=1 Tax=Streptomyces sp. NPDC046685 TaxID=3157202 RepID=UPI0033C62550
MLLIGALLHAVPGLLFRVKVVSGAGIDGTQDARSAEEGHLGSGLWWETDPALAKRFRKDPS